MDITWYFNRLAAMRPAEVSHRMVEFTRKKTARGRLEGWALYANNGVAPVLPGIAIELDRPTDEVISAVSNAAALVLNGRYAALGVRWPEREPADLFPASVWRLDPVTGAHWPGPEQYCFDISYRKTKDRGDVKYVWEFNRLQFLQPLAAHYHVSRSSSALAAIEAAIASWYENNPPFRGIAWNSGIEVSLRAISLLVAVTLCGGALGDRAITQVRTILAASLFWMRRFPSRYSSANNHLVAELAAEFLIVSAMPELDPGGAIAGTAAASLQMEAGLQILEDGVPAEQSPTYGAFTAEFLLLCSLVSDAGGNSLKEALAGRLEAFAGFIGWLASDDGTVPKIGDDDEGRVLTLGVDEAGYAASVSAAIFAYLDRTPTVAKPAYGELRDMVFGVTQAKVEPPKGLKSFRTGGYTCVRRRIGERAIDLFFDHGPLGYLSIAAHGHADALAFVLRVDGYEIFTDPGTYLYHAGGTWRDWFRGTKAHNTLTFNGVDQSTISGAFNWSHKANARLDDLVDGDDWRIVGSQDGYKKRFGIVHTRTISGKGDFVLIEDRLLGAERPEQSILTFQLGADCRAVEVVSGSFSILRDDREVAMITLPTGDGAELCRGDDGGWVSPAFGEKNPATRIQWRGVLGARTVITKIQIF